MSSKSVWRVWIDTGGTFTDCMAVDPQGRVHRAKALSAGALRGRIARAPDERTLDIDATWASKTPLLVGASVRALGEGAQDRTSRIVASTHAGVLQLADARHWRAQELVEVATGEPAPILAARLATGAPVGQPLPPMEMRLATTRGTNALLERKTARVAFFVTKGFGDALRIGDQRRPDPFALCIEKPEPLHHIVVEVPGRLDAAGAEIEPLDLDAAIAGAKRALEVGCDTAAVALVHSWINPAHEQQLAAALANAGFAHVSASHALAPRIKHLVRAQTAVVNAALAPILRAYVDDVLRAAPSASLWVMTSAGGLRAARAFEPVEGLLSGPAGGVVGAADAARTSGFARAITFDMGGTSTDVARISGEPEIAVEHIVGDARVFAPAVAIETVAAGGGSICAVRDGAPVVGPESAGADPGPACYGAGGPLTITDVNLLLGRLDAARFETPIDASAARTRADEVLRDLRIEPASQRALSALEGFLDIANQRMAQAIRKISVRKGFDPAAFAIVAFGGAGPQHACAVAEILGVETVLIPRDASLLSARGLGAAAIERFAQRQHLAPLETAADEAAFARALAHAERDAVAALDAELGKPAACARLRRSARLRFEGQEHALQLDIDNAAEARDAFLARYKRVFGALPVDRSVAVESILVAARLEPADAPLARDAPPSSDAPARVSRAARVQRMRLGGAWIDAPAHDRESLAPAAPIDGPALIVEQRTCAVIPAGWQGEADCAGALVLRRRAPARGAAIIAREKPREIRREMLVSALVSVAEDMGATLARTAVSVNVKERLDFSCALLDANATLVASAPHIPVHLGALGFCARAVRDALGAAPGDIFITNHPAFGGSHLPDVTVLAPVFDEAGERLLGWSASRAHHAEIGGVRPGSMAATARSLAEEGVAIAPMRLFDAGSPRWEDLERVFESAPYPSRAPADNFADIRAAVAAALRAAELLRVLFAEAGANDVHDAMSALIARSEQRVRDAAKALGRAPRAASDRMDDGAVIRVRVAPQPDGGVVIDFAGSASQRLDPLNAPRSVVRSAVAYVMRLLAGEPVPLNEGLLAPVELRTPIGSMLDPRFADHPADSPPVAGGNVETSQRVVDVLLAALGLCANGQGTMNNLAFGGDELGVYETIGGGAGATSRCPGADAVHVHMSNTAITDVEILERRCPVRIERFAIRAGSGGAGLHKGGDGIERRCRFLAPMALSLMTQRRTVAPAGLAGGGAGQPGAQWLERADGSVKPLPCVAVVDARPGDALIVRTPGGGGWGADQVQRAQ